MRKCQVGIHSVSYFPESASWDIGKISRLAKKAGADFFVHHPNKTDIKLEENRYRNLALDCYYVEDSWWIDRAIEFVTPIACQEPLLKKAELNYHFPAFPVSRIITEKVLQNLPHASIIRRWPIYESNSKVIQKRNEVLNLMSASAKKELLDVHSPNIGLTSQQLLTWKAQKKDRGLAVSALLIDERLRLHYIKKATQKRLVEPLYKQVSAVFVKAPSANIKDYQTNNDYFAKLSRFAQKIPKTADWIIKVKVNLPKTTDRNSFIANFTAFVRQAISG